MRSTPPRVHTILASFAPVVRPGSRILDIGAGNGHLARYMAEQFRARVTMIDVAKYNETDLPLAICDSKALAFADRCFDCAVLSFVLHHSRTPDDLLCEALRVARDVIVVENDVHGAARSALTRVVDSAHFLRYGAPPCFITRDRDTWVRSFQDHPVDARLLAEFSLDYGFFRCFTVHLTPGG